MRFDIPLIDIKTCIITHSHCDHFYPDDMMARRKGFSNIKHNDPLIVYSGQDGYDKLVNLLKEQGASPDDIKPVLTEPFEPFEAEGYTITALKATHSQSTSPYIFLLEKDGKTLLYSHDSDDYPEETWEYLSKINKVIDLVSFDCTNCESENTYVGHMGIPACKRARERMIEMGICNDKTRYVLNHFSHNGKHSLYDDIVKTAEKESFDVAYDGMIVEF